MKYQTCKKNIENIDILFYLYISIVLAPLQISQFE